MLSTVKDVLRPAYYKSGAAQWMKDWHHRPAAFRRELAGYMRTHVTTARSTADVPYFQSLTENGFVVIPSLHDAAYIAALRTRIYDIAERVRRGERNDAWEDVIARVALALRQLVAQRSG